MGDTQLIWVGIGTIAGLCTAGVTVVSFWIAFAEKIAAAKAAAERAEAVAEDAKKDTDDLQTQFASQVGQLSIFRETIAREYVDRDALQNLESRLMDTLKGLTERLDRVLSHRPGPR